LYTASDQIKNAFKEGLYQYQTFEYAKAMDNFKAASEYQNHSEAQYYIGVMYYEGQGVKRGYNEALMCFIKASISGDHALSQ
jgi:TPR repeat protein